MGLDHRVPPVLVVLLWALLMAFLAWPEGLATPPLWRLGIAGLVALLGGALCLAGVLSFRRAQTTVNPLAPSNASALVASGVYRYSRNPMYLGFAIMLLAWAIFLGVPQAVLGVVGFVIYMNRFQIAPEEQALQQRFGEAFSRYRQQVRRWL
ncbi:isoprenylcysteine carboxylmethyltransferase family protein [Pseudomonas sp. GD03944]|uniref:methyltransferase family protein n=1 Tax=Pseudomonas sp. GD03944 TaxID=2975409 RepID=UPI00244A5AD8|nr:isoprenylcysteine carboxylmethyltransferase family protein [Pseudomonas sp. GD03944]MDH1265327.1 isoprenylcysteine carboxylmethyltransferase family protein [Pseudomonas sp. GD03944]